jgi:Ca2+-binding EF-hand superfamily protein
MLTEDKLRNAFAVFDKRGTGVISKDDVRALLKGNKKVDDEVWNDIVKSIDINGDG